MLSRRLFLNVLVLTSALISACDSKVIKRNTHKPPITLPDSQASAPERQAARETLKKETLKKNANIKDVANITSVNMINSHTRSATQDRESQTDSYIASPRSKAIEATKSTVKSTSKPADNLWLRIRKGFAFADDILKHPNANKRIEPYRQRFTHSQRMLDRTAENARPYLYFIVTELIKHDIPLELAILPIIESLYDPFAYSSGKASGLWQFIPTTGKRFGLTQDWWQDERRDTIAATGSAIQYLLYLYKRFNNDWLLAMAAYNAGQGTVSKAIRKNRKEGKATDYWSLDLPKETEHYIPKLLAWRDLIIKPEHYKVTLPYIADDVYFDIVNVGSQIDLAKAAQLAEIDIDTMYVLNPAYNRWATDPSPPHDLLVPASQADILRKKLAALPHSQRITWRRYIIKQNDSLNKIAKKFNTTATFIAKINGLKKSRIQTGKALLIPSASRESQYYSRSIEQRTSKKNAHRLEHTRRLEHRVISGENLWDIANKYHVSIQSLAQWNRINPKDVLTINKKLVIWTKENQANRTTKSAEKKRGIREETETHKLFYKVKKGDSLTAIAKRFQVGIKDIKVWNNIHTQKYIKPGQLLTLYVALTGR